MGKYMRKAKAAGEVALMEVAQSSLGVRTRAKTLALQRLQNSVAAAAAASSSGGGSYLQLRSRRLEKPPFSVPSDSRRPKQMPKESSVRNPNPNSRTSSRPRMGPAITGSIRSVSVDCLNKEGSHFEKQRVGGSEVNNQGKEEENADVGIEASFGENVLEFEDRERGIRESTPCSLIRDPENVGTPGSTTRPSTSTEANRRMQNSRQRQIPTTHEMDEFFAGAEEQQLSEFVEKYNYDPVNDKPLPGRYEWVKLDMKVDP